MRHILKKNLKSLLVTNVEFSIWNIFLEKYITKLIKFDFRERITLEEITLDFEVFIKIQNNWKALLTKNDVEPEANFLEIHSLIIAELGKMLSGTSDVKET